MKDEKSCRMRFKIISIVLTVGLIIFAFVHSSMPADISDEESGAVLNFLQNILKSFKINVSLSDYIVRKAAHFSEYTAIGMMLMTCAYSFDRIKPLRFYSQMLFFGLATAVTDESIQLNVPGRSGQVSDILLDFCGVMTGLIIMFTLFSIYRKIRK